MASAVYYPPTNKIYVFGGSDPDAGTVNNLNQIYDIASDVWTTGANMPDVRGFMASGYNPTNGKIYLVSGYNTGDVTSGQPDTREYDPVANIFTSRAPFPHPAGGFASGIINGHLYVAGGLDDNETPPLNTVFDYDIAADTWTQKNNMPGCQNNVRGSAVALDSLLVFGGGNPFIAPGSPASKAAFPFQELKAAAKVGRKIQLPATGNNTNVYLPATDEWRTSASMNASRSFTSGTAIGNNVYAVGGFDATIFFSLASAEVLAVCIPEPAPIPCPTDQYSITPGTDTIVPGDTDIGNHTDDGDTFLSLPFSFQVYNQTYNDVNVSSNGRLDFVTPNEPGGFETYCLPPPFCNIGSYDFTIFGLWEDMRTDAQPGCASFPGGKCGIFTSVTGSAPNRIFNIEWRTVLFNDLKATQNFEVRLYENEPLKKFEVIIGTLNFLNRNHPYVSGVQGDGNAGFFTQDFCTGTPPQNVSSTYTSPGCVPTPTPTPPQCDTGAIQNEGFETGDFSTWLILDRDNVPVVTNTQAHSGTFSAFVGDSVDGFCGLPGVENPGDSSFYQEFTVPVDTSTLSFWHWDCTTDSILFDWQDAYITDTSGNILQTIFHQALDTEGWVNRTVDMTPYAGQTVRVEFLVHLDSAGDLTGMYVDDVQLTIPCGSPTPTSTPTATPTPRSTPSPRPRPTPHPRPTVAQ